MSIPRSDRLGDLTATFLPERDDEQVAFGPLSPYDSGLDSPPPDYRPPTWPGSDMQMHFEIYVDDLARQEQRLLDCGATKPGHQDPDDPSLVVLLDPAGHPFCIFEHPVPAE